MARSSPASWQGYLLDTNVISLLAPGRQSQLPQGYAAWLHRHDAQLFIPCIAVAELAEGIAKLRRSGAVARSDRLDDWLEALIAGFGDRILALDAKVARIAGSLSDDVSSRGRHPGFADVAIAAMARSANLLLLTRHLKHFMPLGTVCMDPMAELPD